MKMPLKRSGFTPVWFTPLKSITRKRFSCFSCFLLRVNRHISSSFIPCCLVHPFSPFQWWMSGRWRQTHSWPNLISRSANVYCADRWWARNYNSFPKLCFFFFSGADVETFRSSVLSSSFVLRLRHPPAPHKPLHTIYSPARLYNIFTRLVHTIWPGL